MTTVLYCVVVYGFLLACLGVIGECIDQLIDKNRTTGRGRT